MTVSRLSDGRISFLSWITVRIDRINIRPSRRRAGVWRLLHQCSDGKFFDWIGEVILCLLNDLGDDPWSVGLYRDDALMGNRVPASRIQASK